MIFSLRDLVFLLDPSPWYLRLDTVRYYINLFRYFSLYSFYTSTISLSIHTLYPLHHLHPLTTIYSTIYSHNACFTPSWSLGPRGRSTPHPTGPRTRPKQLGSHLSTHALPLTQAMSGAFPPKSQALAKQRAHLRRRRPDDRAHGQRNGKALG